MLTQGSWSLSGPGTAVFPASSLILSHTHPPNPRVLIRPAPPPPPLPPALGLPRSALGISAHAYPQTPPPAFLAISCSFLDPSPNVPFSSKSPLFRSTWDPVDLQHSLVQGTGRVVWKASPGLWGWLNDVEEGFEEHRSCVTAQTAGLAVQQLPSLPAPGSSVLQNLMERVGRPLSLCLPSLDFILGGQREESMRFRGACGGIYTCF